MNHLLRFENYKPIYEKIQPITANWFIIDGEGSFEKKEQSGFFVFNRVGTFSIIYNKKASDSEEARIDFYTSKENSKDKNTICECKIVTKSGEERTVRKFTDITPENVWEIITSFFDYCDLEKSEKEVTDRFLLGFSKTLKEVLKFESSDQLPSAFKTFYKFISEWSKKSDPKIEIKATSNNYELLDLIKRFMSNFKKA
jgi:hypothetical protein